MPKSLAQEIDFLGGTPTVKVPDVPDASDRAAALKADMEFGAASAGSLPEAGDRGQRSGVAGRSRGAAAVAAANAGPPAGAARRLGGLTPRAGTIKNGTA